LLFRGLTDALSGASDNDRARQLRSFRILLRQWPLSNKQLLGYETELMDPEVRRSEKAAEFIADRFSQIWWEWTDVRQS
jgi:hypothetical protein